MTQPSTFASLREANNAKIQTGTSYSQVFGNQHHMIAALAALAIQKQAPADYLAAAEKLRQTGAEVQVSNVENPAWEIWFDLTGKIKTKNLKLLQGVKGLGAVRIMTDDLTDAMVADIKDNPDLHLLVVMSKRLTDRCTEHISKMSGLKKLDINKASLTRAGIARLPALKKLERLYLYNAKVAGPDLKPLESMKWLKLLDLPPTTPESALNMLKLALPKTQIVCRKD